MKKAILFGIGGLIVGAAIVWMTAVVAVNGNHTDIMNKMGMDTKTTRDSSIGSSGDISMKQMTDSLKDKSGDDFDKAFISGMIMHHQGAVDMASLAKQNAKHEEITTMASDIVGAQTKEINQMQMWQMEWGYTSSSSHDMMNMGH